MPPPPSPALGCSRGRGTGVAECDGFTGEIGRRGVAGSRRRVPLCCGEPASRRLDEITY